MQYLIGIVPPNKIKQAIENIQEQFGDNRLEPHITVRPPVIVTEEAGWMDAIERVCKSFPVIEIQLPKTGNFGDRVLYIDVKSELLGRLHSTIMPAIKPFEKQQTGIEDIRPFTAHLTLGRRWCGFTQQHFAAMKVLANEWLSKVPISFTAQSLRVYHKPGKDKRYEPLKDVPLADL